MNIHKLTEGAVLLAAYIVILLMTLYIPFLGIVLNFFLALPFIIFAAKNHLKNVLLFLLGALVTSFITGGIAGISFTFFSGLTGSVIGDFIREKKSRLAGFLAGSFAFLIVLVAQYAIMVTFFEINFIKESMLALEQSFIQAMNLVQVQGEFSQEELILQFKEVLQFAETLVPSVFLLASFFYVFVTEAVSLPIAGRFVENVPKWKPFRELVLPKSFLWYYLIVLLVSLFIKMDIGSYWYTVITNLSFILQVLMTIQGLSLIYYFFYIRNQSRTFPILITVAIFVMPILFLPLVRILGIIDLGFHLRERLKEKS